MKEWVLVSTTQTSAASFTAAYLLEGGCVGGTVFEVVAYMFA